MIALIVTLVAVLLLLVGNGLWWRRRVVHSEFSRKFIHVTVGSFVAFWPFFLSWDQIKLLSVAFLVVVGVSKYLHVFRAIHSVQRPTLGELYFALAVGGVAFISQDRWIYMAAILQMSLADGLAAVTGVRYGKQSYLVFGHRKSFIGSAAFFVTSFVILMSYAGLASGNSLGLLPLTGIAALATAVENVGVKGLDNLLVPLLVATLLANR
jgi:phytol kinase